jgi:hypothetical protein
MSARLACATLAALLLGTAASAEPYTGVAFAGGAAGDGVSGYAGVVKALPGGSLGKGLALRLSASDGSYEYMSGGTGIDGRFASAETALVYQLSGNWGWANFSGGPRVTDVRLSPRDPSNDRRGTRLDLALQSDGAVQIDRSWRLGWLGSVGVRDGTYFSRMDLGALVGPRTQTRLGLEAGLQGDPSYRSTSLGLFASTRLGGSLEGRISAGASDQDHRRTHPFVTLGLSILF